MLTSCLFEYYQSMVDGIRKLDCFFFIYSEKTAWKCVSAYVSTVVLLTVQVYSLIFGTHLGE